MPRRREAGTTGLTCEEKASNRVQKNIGSPEFLWMTGGRRSKGLFKAVRGAMPRPGLVARTIMHACPTRRQRGEGNVRIALALALLKKPSSIPHPFTHHPSPGGRGEACRIRIRGCRTHSGNRVPSLSGHVPSRTICVALATEEDNRASERSDRI